MYHSIPALESIAAFGIPNATPHSPWTPLSVSTRYLFPIRDRIIHIPLPMPMRRHLPSQPLFIVVGELVRRPELHHRPPLARARLPPQHGVAQRVGGPAEGGVPLIVERAVRDVEVSDELADGSVCRISGFLFSRCNSRCVKGRVMEGDVPSKSPRSANRSPDGRA